MSSPGAPSPNPNFEQQRKRAKELCRAHREGRLEAAERICRHLPRARGQSPTQVLASPFTLSEAQLVVAREAGFASWVRLKRQIELSRQGSDAGLEALLDAALAGEPQAIRAALEAQPDLAGKSLHAAAALGDAAATFRLLDGAPGAATLRGGLRQWTPLYYCCAARHGRDQAQVVRGRVEIAARLLALGADPKDEIASREAPGGFRSVLQAAASDSASAELVGLLLDASASVAGATGGGAGPPTPLTDAVTGGSLACLERLLAARPASWQRREALEEAIFRDRADMAKLLLEHDAEPSRAGRRWGWGGGCLHAAILLGRGQELLQVLLASDVDLTARDPDGHTAYAVAVRSGHDLAAELLRRRGASDAELDDLDRVIAACVRLQAGQVRSLLATDPDLGRRYRYIDHLMLGWVIRNGPKAAVPLLLEAGLDPNLADTDGQTALHLAVQAGDADTISALQAAGASADVPDFRGRTPFGAPLPGDEQRARDDLFEQAADFVAFGELDSLRALLDDEPALVHWRSPRDHRATLLIYCGANGTERPRQRTPPNAPAIAQLLIDRGSDVNATCRLYGGGIGATTLAMVLTSMHTMDSPDEGELVRVLVRAGARLDLWGDSKTPLWWAIGWGARRSFAALVAAGLPIDDLWLAAAANRVDLLGQLLARGDDVNARTRGGCTPLHAAALMGHEEAAALLLAHGADPTLRDAQWNGTAAGKARWRHHPALAELIENRR